MDLGTELESQNVMMLRGWLSRPYSILEGEIDAMELGREDARAFHNVAVIGYVEQWDVDGTRRTIVNV